MLSKLTFIWLLATAFAKPNGELETKPATNATECITPSLQRGTCVPYFQCKSVQSEDSPSSADDTSDIRETPCSSYIDVCCLDPPPETKSGCGRSNPIGLGVSFGKIKNEAKFGEFPWMCGINKVEPLNENDSESMMINVYIGGGSLIHPSVVLTAAHIASNPAPKVRVRAGEWDSQTQKEQYPHQDRDVKDRVLHEEFNKGNFYYDVALLFLTEPMDLTVPNVGVACLPPPDEIVPGGTQCFATGWGKDKFIGGKYQFILKKIEVPVVERNSCASVLGTTELTDSFELHSSFMCAGGEPGEDTCTGDGGSPLVCPIEGEEDRFMQAGIVSWGVGCGENAIPGVYANVASLRKWIDDKVEENGYDTEIYSAEV